MSYQSTALAPVAAEVINQVSGTYAAPFWPLPDRWIQSEP